MRLDYWLIRIGENWSVFVCCVNLLLVFVIVLCNDFNVWVLWEMVCKIVIVINGEVILNDFFGLFIIKEYFVFQICVVEVICVFECGEMVVVIDDDDCENEGDLIVVVLKVIFEQMVFMVCYISGIICVFMMVVNVWCLWLDLMVVENDVLLVIVFIILVDYCQGLIMGIFVEECCLIVCVFVNLNVGVEDLVCFGYIFLFVVKEGGVMICFGYIEVVVDLCCLVGLEQVGVISELVNDDGIVKCGNQVVEFVVEYDFKMVLVFDFIVWCQCIECMVEWVNEQLVNIIVGLVYVMIYLMLYDFMYYVVIVYGDIFDGCNVFVCLQLEFVLDDVFGNV